MNKSFLDVTFFVGTVFASSIIWSHIIKESPVILAKYLPFSQLHVEVFLI